MSATLWIAFGFTFALVAFLMVTFFVKDTSSPTQYNTLHFLTSLCAGFAGGFFTGEALVRFEQTIGEGGKLIGSGTAGCALFFVLWFSYPKRADPPASPPLKDRIKLSFGEGWTFEQAARAIVEAARAIVQFEGFTKDQLSVPLRATDIDAPSPRDAINQLRHQSDQLPAYQVSVEGGMYHIRA